MANRFTGLNRCCGQFAPTIGGCGDNGENTRFYRCARCGGEFHVWMGIYGDVQRIEGTMQDWQIQMDEFDRLMADEREDYAEAQGWFNDEDGSETQTIPVPEPMPTFDEVMANFERYESVTLTANDGATLKISRVSAMSDDRSMAIPIPDKDGQAVYIREYAPDSDVVVIVRGSRYVVRTETIDESGACICFTTIGWADTKQLAIDLAQAHVQGADHD